MKTINWILFAILSCLTLEALLSRQTQFASDDVVAIPQLDVSTNIASLRPPTIGKLLMQYGPINPMYERALATHVPYNQQHNYPMSILRDTTVGNLWSKPAYMLQHILIELEKPYSTRLRWLFWFDSDIVVLNPNVPLEIFLPPPTPDHTYDHIRALVTQDSNGLNTGVFALKVDRWSVNLLTATLATRMALPAVHLRYNDQSAMEFWLQSDLFRNNTMHVPQRWFNAYPGSTRTLASAAMIRPFRIQTCHRANGGPMRSRKGICVCISRAMEMEGRLGCCRGWMLRSNGRPGGR